LYAPAYPLPAALQPLRVFYDTFRQQHGHNPFATLEFDFRTTTGGIWQQGFGPQPETDEFVAWASCKATT